MYEKEINNFIQEYYFNSCLKYNYYFINNICVISALIFNGSLSIQTLILKYKDNAYKIDKIFNL